MEADKLFKAPIYLNILRFFHENPACIDTPRGVATWVGANKQEVRRVLLKLSKMKILTAHKVSSTTGYSYTRDAKLIKKIGLLLKKFKKEEEKC